MEEGRLTASATILLLLKYISLVVCVVVLVDVVTADDADSKRVCNKPRREIKMKNWKYRWKCLILFLFKRGKMWQIFTLQKELRTTVVLIIIL